MTVIPSVEYIEMTDFNPFEKVRYLDRDNRFTGRVVYHDLNGNFVHGWGYEDGEITRSIKPECGTDDPVVMMSPSGSDGCVLVQEWGWTRTCTDWYTYDYYGNPVYTGTTCTDWEWGLIRSYWECSSGGGHNPSPPAVASPRLQAIIALFSLTNTQISMLNSALSQLIAEGCLQEAMYNKLVAKNVKLHFGMVENPTDETAPANYYAGSKSLKFKNDNTINADNLKEELFHALQDAYYSGGISQYGKDAQDNKLPGHVNVEFEAKVFKDISMVMGSYSAFFKTETPEEIAANDEYGKWIGDVQSYPIFLGEPIVYNYWLNLFNQLNPQYSSPFSNDFKSFHSLKNLIDGTDCL
ncbi:hypothetical protein [Proteiniphilum sp.]|uniref:hypothetical protein n=1 Tax=Proteiniphilum sp. TaxID=1926877 RepID=UPI002B21BA7E|nr:hypothetical protein [Proteiniphilum sp.]